VTGAPKEMVGTLFGGSDISSTSCQSLWKKLYGFWMNSVAMFDGRESMICMKLQYEHRVSKEVGCKARTTESCDSCISSCGVPRCNGSVRASLTTK